MPIVRELVTRLRYDVDSRGVSGYRLAIDRAAQSARQAASSIRTSGSVASSASSGLTRAATALGNLADRASRVNDEIRDAQMARYSRAWDGVRNYIRGTNRELDEHGNKVRHAASDTQLLWRAWGAIGAVIGGISLVRITDEFRGAEDQINQMVEGSENQERAYQGVYSIARKTRNEFAGLAGLFSSLQFSTEQTGLNLDQNLQLTEAIATALKVGGGSRAGQEGALIQTIQGFQSGRFQAEELNSILDGAKGLARAIAEGMGVQVGDLKQLASDGKLTADAVAKAILSQSAVLNAQLGNVRKSFGDIGKTINLVVGGMIHDFEKGSGAISWAIGGILSTIDRLEWVVRTTGRVLTDIFGDAAAAAKFVGYAIVSAVGPVALRAVYRMTSALRAMALGANASLLPFALISGAVLGVLLLLDDVLAWAKGADSYFADLVGPFEDWRKKIDEVKNSFDPLLSSAKELGVALGLIKDDANDVSRSGEGKPPLAQFFEEVLNSVIEINRELANFIRALARLENWDFKGAGNALLGLPDEASSAEAAQTFGERLKSRLFKAPFQVREGSEADKFFKAIGEPLMPYLQGFMNPRTTSGYDARLAARAAGTTNNRGGDITVTQHNTITTASGSPSQVGAAVGRATEGVARVWQGTPFFSPSVERSP